MVLGASGEETVLLLFSISALVFVFISPTILFSFPMHACSTCNIKLYFLTIFFISFQLILLFVVVVVVNGVVDVGFKVAGVHACVKGLLRSAAESPALCSMHGVG